MKRHPIAAAVATLSTTFVLLGPAMAQEAQIQPEPAASPPLQQRMQERTQDPAARSPLGRMVRTDWDRRHRASRMMGTAVRDDAGTRLGSIEDVVIDDEGQVAYAVIGAGGFLGMGEDLYAVPWTSLRKNEGDDFFSLSMSQSELKQAYGFDRGNWPALGEARWRTGRPATRPAAGTAPAAPGSPYAPATPPRQ